MEYLIIEALYIMLSVCNSYAFEITLSCIRVKDYLIDPLLIRKSRPDSHTNFNALISIVHWY
jgi:hypothetical protein